MRLRPERLADSDVVLVESENDIVIVDPFISAQHAAFFLRDGSWWVSDLGSTNGTLLNGQVIATEEPIIPGDIVQLGGIQLRVGAG